MFQVLNKLKSRFLEHYVGVRGWQTSRKIVVLESDDWGTIRMPSKKVYDYLLKKNYPVDKSVYDQYDTLESASDLTNLFEVLSSTLDSKGNPAVLTANNIVANADFDKIKESDFSEYFYEPFTQTLKRQVDGTEVLDLYKKGIDTNLFIPQFHGREHINVPRWMQALQENKKTTKEAFDLKMYSFNYSNKLLPSRALYLDSFGHNPNSHTYCYEDIISDGTNLFEKIHGYRSTSFIAPCYTWSPKINKHLKDSGIDFLQGGRVQINSLNDDSIKKHLHYTGKKNANNQLYTIRNCFFEVATNQNKDWVNSCLGEITSAFKYRKPAIISTHRVNFVGGLSSESRDTSLRTLKTLLQKIKTTWPNVEFLSSDVLGKAMSESSKKFTVK